ncbi:hypothetical protein [Streptodolium elevatio]|uniref:Restriction endonuclease type IV Mrr domain-containing protein n=1 Tax=Streptodolium elevatio TaxID=3157996 RepID=A0ABV3DFR2_9ACTN
MLSDEGIEVVTPGKSYREPAGGSIGTWLPRVDFLCAVLSKRIEWSTPPAVFVDIGVAIGSRIPILVIIEPPRMPDIVLSPLQVAHIPLRNADALSLRINAFVRSLKSPTPSLLEPRRPDLDTFESLRRELRGISPDQRPEPLYLEIERVVVKLLNLHGALIEPSNYRKGDRGFDFAAWIPGTESVLPEPLLFEVKMSRTGQIRSETFERLQLAVEHRNASMGVIIFYGFGERPRLPLENWPLIMAFELDELLESLESTSLAQVFIDARNALAHGRPHR